MIIDKRLQVATDQAVTGAATSASTDAVDLGTDRDVGPGRPLWLIVAIKVALGGTTPTFNFSIQTDDNSSFSSPTTLVTSETLSGAAAAPAGKLMALAVPLTNERYIRAAFTLAGTSPTITVDAWFTDQEPTVLGNLIPDGL
jgi:hypothetical protein